MTLQGIRSGPNSSNPLYMCVIPQCPRPIKTGTRQEAIISRTLFNNSVLDAQAKCLPSCIIGGIDVSLICYADDILNLKRSIQRIHQNFKILKDEYSKSDCLLILIKQKLSFSIGKIPLLLS